MCCGVLLCAGCTLSPFTVGSAAWTAAAHGVFSPDDPKFIEKNYAAADYLVQQADDFVDRHRDLIVAKPLSDETQPDMASDFGKMVPEQIGIRLSQLGYRLDLRSVATQADTNYLEPGSYYKQRPDFVLSGTYLRRRSEMDVSTRITDLRNGRVVAVFDYTLPLRGDARDLARPKPRIIRMTTPE